MKFEEYQISALKINPCLFSCAGIPLTNKRFVCKPPSSMLRKTTIFLAHKNQKRLIFSTEIKSLLNFMHPRNQNDFSVEWWNSPRLNPNEVLVAKVDFKLNGMEIFCQRSLYLGLNGSDISSVLMTTHCVNPSLNQGTYSSRKYKRGDDEVLFDLVCTTTGYSDVIVMLE